jgi:hypothetical protein
VLKDIVDVQAVGEYRLRLRFEDGAEGEVDLSTIVPMASSRPCMIQPYSKRCVSTRSLARSAGRMAPTSILMSFTLWSEENRRQTCVNEAACPHHRSGLAMATGAHRWRVCFVRRDGDAHDVEIVDDH